MSGFTFENFGTNTYLVYTLSDNEQMDSMSLGMLTNNKIPGLATTIFTQIDDTRYVRYNVSSKVSVRQFFDGSVNKKRLLGVLNGVTEAMLSAEDYMIEADSILLDPDYIFADVSSCETILVCIPTVAEREKPNLNVFFKNIMFSTQFDQTENCDHVAKIINYLNSTPNLFLEDFQKLLKSLSAPEKPVEKPVEKRQVSQPVIKPQTDHSQKGQATVLSQTSLNPAVPQKPQVPVTPVVQEPENNEVPITFMHLMQHYNKENAELYKKQKERRKAEADKAKNESKDKSKGKNKNESQVNPGFAIPGMTAPPVTEMPGNAYPENKTAEPKSNTNIKTQQPVVQQLPKQPTVQNVPATGNANFGNTTVLNAGMRKGETTVLNAASTPVQTAAYLIRMKNHEKIVLNKPVFRIGKERSYVDYFVVDNPAISRSHANIVCRDGAYYVVDTNSTNHTFVDGEMIQSNLEVKLNHASKIRLANEEFELRLY